MTASQKPPADSGFGMRGTIVTGAVAVLLLLVGFGGWAAFSQIAGAVVAQGQLEVEDQRQIVQHPDGGVVAAIKVREGDRVQAGDVLIVLDGSTVQSELTIVEGQLFEILARRGRLEAERDQRPEITFTPDLIARAETDPAVADLMQGQATLFVARRETLSREDEQLARRAEQAASQITGITAQIEASREQARLINEELTDMQTLRDKGLAQEGRVLSLQREAARLAGSVGELIAARAETEGRITEISIERDKLVTKRREEAETELRDLGYRALELAERRRALTEQVARLEIRAPTSGIVLSLQVSTPRAVLRAAEPALFIVPQDRPLVIAAQVSPLNVDEVSPGQPVRLRFPSLPSRTTPELQGSVAKISADSLQDERTGQTYYRAEITLNEGEAQKLGQQALIPGMPVEAYLRTGERSPIVYLLKPFLDYFNRAFRET
ncbi:HlyD family type I secretion periplasmic adaptor subunit [Paracoccus sp. p4-l81]|uniref:HlyD family type I secretion periplasmic adaptor subunit n=1 Tax=unclassified Paracoccus (in: a-proteobacteria) TaxID=2688777 RepID=UPI0035B7FA43